MEVKKKKSKKKKHYKKSDSESDDDYYSDDCIKYNKRSEKSKDNKCTCIKYCSNFCINYCNGSHGTKIIYNIPEILNYIIYGFDLSNNRINLYINSNDGIGFSTDIKHQINNTGYVQIDLGDFIRIKSLKCDVPKIKITNILLNTVLQIYGSNIQGIIGNLLYSYTNKINNCEDNTIQEIIIPSYNTLDSSCNGDLYRYGTIPYRYISITTITGSVLLNSLTLFYNKK
jgi:hypothetical protein